MQNKSQKVYICMRATSGGHNCMSEGSYFCRPYNSCSDRLELSKSEARRIIAQIESVTTAAAELNAQKQKLKDIVVAKKNLLLQK